MPWRIDRATSHDELGCGGEAVQTELVHPPPTRGAFSFDEEEADVAEDLEMMRDRRLADVDSVDDFGHTHRPPRLQAG